MSAENETLLSGLSCVWVFGMWLAMCFCWHARSKKKKRTKIEKEASGKNGVMDVRGRMEEGMKGWMTLMSRPFFGFFNLYPCGIPALPNFLLASLVPALTWTFCLWKVSRGCSASLHSHLTNHSLQLPLILILSPSLLSPPLCWWWLINFQTLIREAKCAVVPSSRLPPPLQRFLSSSLGGQGDQGVHQGHGQAAREEAARRRDRQREEKDSFLREAKERLQCLSGSPASLPEAPSLPLFTSSCSLSLSLCPPAPPFPFSFLPSLTGSNALSSTHTVSHTPSLLRNCPQNLAARKAGAVIHILATPYESAQPISASQLHPPSCTRQSYPTIY